MSSVEQVAGSPSVASNSRAKAAAEFVHECMFPSRRGVLDCWDTFIVFGNDGYDLGGPPKREAEMVEEYLGTLGFQAAEFGVSSNGYSWAMVVDNYYHQPIDLGKLRKILATCWDKACEEAKAAKA